MRRIIIFLRFITVFQVCRCQLYNVVLSDEERDTVIIGYSTPDDRITIQHADKNFNNFNLNQNPPLNLRITNSKGNQMSNRNSRKEIDFDFIKSVPNTEDGLVNGSETQSKLQETTIETTTELSLEMMFDYIPKTNFITKKTDAVRDMESYLNLTRDLKLKSYDDVVKSNGFDLEALLNHTFNDGISENVAKHNIKTNFIDPKHKIVFRKNTNKDEAYDMIARERDDVSFSDFNSETEGKTPKRNFRRNLNKVMELKPKFILLENNNGQARYSMITDTSDLINPKPSKIIFALPTHITSEKIVMDDEMRNIHDNMRSATNSTFTGVPMKLLLSLLGSNVKEASATEEEYKPITSPKIHDSVISFIKDSARNIGDIVYGRG